MPVYLITDTQCDTKVMVEADRPAGAINALINDRFVASSSLDAAAALAHAADGVHFLRADRDFAEVDSPAAAEKPMADKWLADGPGPMPEVMPRCTCSKVWGDNGGCAAHGKGTEWASAKAEDGDDD
jgi:hypothetical protein